MAFSLSEFFKIGDSAIVSVGDFKLNDGVSSDAYPLGRSDKRVFSTPVCTQTGDSAKTGSGHGTNIS
jgi:hypothetical protein